MVSLGAHMVFIVQIVECEPITTQTTNQSNLMQRVIHWSKRVFVVALFQGTNGTRCRVGFVVQIANISSMTFQLIASLVGQSGAMSHLKDAI